MGTCKRESDGAESKILLALYAIGIPALLYFLGWMNLFYYLRYYGVYLFSIDIPFHFFFIYSFSVIKYIIWLIDDFLNIYVVLIAVFVIPWMVWKFSPKAWVFIVVCAQKICALFGHSAGAAVALFILFVLGHQAAKTSGINHAEDIRSDPQPLIRIYLKPSHSPEKQSADAAKSDPSNTPMPNPFNDDIQFDVTKRVTVLFATKKKYIFLVQRLPTSNEIVASVNNNPGYRPEAQVVEIRADEIIYLTTKLEEMVP